MFIVVINIALGLIKLFDEYAYLCCGHWMVTVKLSRRIVVWDFNLQLKS